MNTILTDDELPPLQPQDHPEPHSFAWSEQEMQAIRARDRLVEAAVLAKLAAQEPVAWLHVFKAVRGGETYSTPDEFKCPPQARVGFEWRFSEPLYAAPLPAVVPATIDRDAIRRVFMAHGFTIKDGQTDLKSYVYEAAEALLKIAAPQPAVVQVPQGWKLVPVEPTVEMAQALIDYKGEDEMQWPRNVSPNFALAAYRILLAAAPEGPAQAACNSAKIAAKWYLQARNRNNLAGEAIAISIGHEIDAAAFVEAIEDPELQRYVTDWMRKIDRAMTSSPKAPAPPIPPQWREAMKVARATITNFEIKGPDDDGVLWLVLHGNGTTGRAMFNLGSEAFISGKVAALLEQDRRAALAQLDALGGVE